VEEHDLIFAASGSEELLVRQEDLAGMAAAGAAVGGQRRFVDISVPRNIAHDINELEGSIVYNVDDLKVGREGPSGSVPSWVWASFGSFFPAGLPAEALACSGFSP
jgi:hypothetical protein